MSSWNSGYVTDLGYTHGFYRELTPRLLTFAGLLRGQTTPDPDRSLTYCELGCGQGFTINVLAAANPHIQFYGTDFNPSHIAGAQALAQEAELSNLHLYDQAFGDFVDEATLPDQFDMIVLHGIYSWITPQVRGQVVEFLRRKLRPGGLVYCSYNCLPGWSPAAPLRHLMYLHGKSTGGPTATRLQPALEFTKELIEKGALYFAANPNLKSRVERMESMPRNYLAHEYLNDAWSLLYHSDVVQEFSEAKLSYFGPANLLDHIDAINLSADQQELLKGLADPTLRETVRDFLVNQQFRRDLFLRGAVPMSLEVAATAWRGLPLALTVVREDIKDKVTGARGDASLQPEVYGPILDVLSKGPTTFADLVAEPNVAKLGGPRIQQALAILAGAGHLQPSAPSKLLKQARQQTRAFNSVVMKRALSSSDLTTLASPVTGGGVTVDRFGQLFLLAAAQGEEPVKFAWQALAKLGQRLIKEGKTLGTEAENLTELDERLKAFNAKQRPVLQSLGVA